MASTSRQVTCSFLGPDDRDITIDLEPDANIRYLKEAIEHATGHKADCLSILSEGISGNTVICDNWIITDTATEFNVTVHPSPKSQLYRVAWKTNSENLPHQKLLMSVTTTQDGNEMMDVEYVIVLEDSSEASYEGESRLNAIVTKNGAKGRYFHKSGELHWEFYIAEEEYDCWQIALLYIPKTSTWIPLRASTRLNPCEITEFSVTKVDNIPFEVQTE